MLGNQTTNALGTYDFTQMDLVQLNKPSEGQDVAVIETNLGTITAVLYAEFAPKTVANFKKRAEEGFYDGKPFFALQLSLIHISEPTRQAEISYAVFCLKKKSCRK